MIKTAKLLALLILIAVAISSCARGFGCPMMITKSNVPTNTIKSI